RYSVDSGEAKIPGQAHGAEIVGEKPVQSIGHRGYGEAVEASPALVALERFRAAGIESQPRCIDHRLRQGRDIAETQVQALPGDWMNRMRGVADKGEPRIDVTRCMHEF